MIELEAADRIADNAGIACIDRLGAEDGRAKAPDVLNGESGGAVFVGVEVEQPEDTRRDPARTDLVTRKARAVDNDDVPPGAVQHPRARGAGRTAADDYGIAVNHCTDQRSS